MKKEKIKKIGQEVIQYEIEALKNLKKSINLSFSKMVELILSCRNGKVIISGF